MASVTWTNAMALLLQSHLSDAKRDIDPWVIQCCIVHRRRDIFPSWGSFKKLTLIRLNAKVPDAFRIRRHIRLNRAFLA
jgi:hypothetical protein